MLGDEAGRLCVGAVDRNIIFKGAERLGEPQELGRELHGPHDIADDEVDRWIVDTNTLFTGFHRNLIPS